MEGEVRAKPGVQPWVEALNPTDRAAYEQARCEEIDDLAVYTREVLLEGLGASALDPEQLDEVTKRVGTGIRDAFEQGMQSGLDIGRQESQVRIDRMRSVEINRLGGWG